MINLDNIKPIDQQNIEEKTTEVIRNLILDGQLNPGTHVTEMSLSKTLKYERLLVHKPNKGMFVIELTAKDVWECIW